MTQRMQIHYHPGWSYKPVQAQPLPGLDDATHDRLALKAIALAEEFGKTLTLPQAYERSAQNYYDVTQMAEVMG